MVLLSMFSARQEKKEDADLNLTQQSNSLNLFFFQVALGFRF